MWGRIPSHQAPLENFQYNARRTGQTLPQEGSISENLSSQRNRAFNNSVTGEATANYSINCLQKDLALGIWGQEGSLARDPKIVYLCSILAQNTDATLAQVQLSVFIQSSESGK